MDLISTQISNVSENLEYTEGTLEGEGKFLVDLHRRENIVKPHAVKDQ